MPPPTDSTVVVYIVIAIAVIGFFLNQGRKVRSEIASRTEEFSTAQSQLNEMRSELHRLRQQQSAVDQLRASLEAEKTEIDRLRVKLEAADILSQSQLEHAKKVSENAEQRSRVVGNCSKCNVKMSYCGSCGVRWYP